MSINLYSNVILFYYNITMKITNVIPLDVYKIHVVFENGIEWDVDLTPHDDASIFLQLAEDETRKNPQISGNWSTIYRNEALSLDDEVCYMHIVGKK